MTSSFEIRVKVLDQALRLAAYAAGWFPKASPAGVCLRGLGLQEF
jgi:hypothetical protein